MDDSSLHHSKNHTDTGPRKIAAARLSIASNTTLTVVKLVTGVLSGSVSVLSEAAHSCIDLLASFFAYFAVKVSNAPADKDHPYGHGKFESLSGMAEAVLIVIAALAIVYESVSRLLKPHPTPRLDYGIAAMVLSVVVNFLVSRHLSVVAKETDSIALSGDAQHLRADVFTSAGVLVGLTLARLTGWNELDAIAAITVAVLILYAAWKLSREALNPLVDSQLPDEEVEAVRSILAAEQAVLDYHKLRTRKSGSSRYVDAHILMEDNLSLKAAHDLTEKLEDRIRERLPNAEITLHTEPYRDESRHQFERHGGPKPSE